MERKKFNFNFPVEGHPVSSNDSSVEGHPVTPNDSSVEGHPVTPNKIEQLMNLENKVPNPFEIKYIFRKRIRFNTKNNYPMEDIEKMKNSILNYGLQQNLTVVYVTDEDMYVLEAGHTRTRALDAIIEQYENYDNPDDENYKLYLQNVQIYNKKGYPCRVTDIISENQLYDYSDMQNLDDIPDSVIDSEIRLIITNEVSRERDAVTIQKNISRLEKLYQRKNRDKKRSEKTNVIHQISSDLGLSATQVKNYKKLDKLIPELREEFEKNHITLKESSNYASLSVEEQEMIVHLMKSGQKLSEKELKQLSKQLSEKDKKIVQLETDLENLSQNLNSNSGSPGDLEQEMESKNTEIDQLKKELKLMKENKTAPSTISFSSEQARMAKSELSVKAEYETAKTSLKKWMQSIYSFQEIYNSVSVQEKSQLGLLTPEEIMSLKLELKNILYPEETNHEYA